MKRQRDRRLESERRAYDESRMWERGHALHQRFICVHECVNSMRAENYYYDLVARNVPGKDVLEYGCGDGWNCEYLLNHNPHTLVGIDISQKGLAHAQMKFGHSAGFSVMDAHAMGLAGDSFDTVVGRAILHHLDFERAVSEIRRVLKPGGVALFTEPLGDNPLAKLWRLCTPAVRTKSERPLSRATLQWADRQFSRSHHMFANLVSTPIAVACSLLHARPDCVPLRMADRIDVALACLPIRTWMRMVVLCWQK